MVCCCGVAAAAAYRSVGSAGVEGVVCSGALCLIPGWLTIFASHWFRASPQAVYLVVAAMVNRLLFVLVGVLTVSTLRPDLGFYEFLVWLIAIYMVALALETWLILMPTVSSSA